MSEAATPEGGERGERPTAALPSAVQAPDVRRIRISQVRQALGLTRDDFYLLGHSWGGILATEYALKFQQHLKGLVISNMMMSIPDYNRYASDVLAKRMDPAVVKEIRQLEKKGDYESERCMELLLPNFYAKHISTSTSTCCCRARASSEPRVGSRSGTARPTSGRSRCRRS